MRRARIIGVLKLEEFARRHARSRKAFANWEKVVRAASWKNSEELKRTFNSVDYDDGKTIFKCGREQLPADRFGRLREAASSDRERHDTFRVRQGTVEKIMATQAEPIRLARGRVLVADLVVKTRADHERALGTVEGLMGRRRTAEEDALLDILADLIEKFESKTRAGLGHEPTPVETIRFLMSQNKLSQKDLWDLLGGKSHTSEILSGKRKVSNRQAGLLGKRFKISPSAFVSFA